MPFRSARQRRYMFANHPKTARRWARRYGYKVGGGKTKRQAGRRGGKKSRKK